MAIRPADESLPVTRLEEIQRDEEGAVKETGKEREMDECCKGSQRNT